MLLSSIHKDQTKKTHYSHFFENKKEYAFHASISKQLKSNSSYRRYIVSLISNPNTGKKVTGKLLILVKKGIDINFLPGDHILFQGLLHYLPNNGNPFDFNYNQFLIKKEIFAQTFVKDDRVQILERKSFSLDRWSAQTKNRIINQWKSNGLSSKAQSLLLAIVLGDKSFVSSDMIQSFSNAGIIHTLAVSGLHVGILYLMIQTLLGYLLPFRQFRFVNIIIIVSILWMYALLVGFKPSVTRTVILFSLFGISTGLNRLMQPFNTLAFSAFLLLLYKPAIMFDVGFQLSYGAVLSILWFYPKISSLIEFNSWLFQKSWELICISVSAQIGIVPLLLFYFHQFPILFPITNLIAIPFVTILIWMGIGSLALFVLPFGVPFYFKTINWLIHILEYGIGVFSNMKIGLIENISFDLFQVACMYVAIIAFGLAKGWKDKRRIVIGLFLILILQTYTVLKKIDNQTGQEFIVFHDHRNSLGGIRVGNEFFRFSDTNETKRSLVSYRRETSVTKNYTLCTTEQYETNVFIKKKNFIFLQSRKILIMNKKTDPKLIPLMDKGDVIWIKNSPNIEFKKLPLAEGVIFVADGSNVHSKVTLWKNELANHEFHHTLVDGTFILIF